MNPAHSVTFARHDWHRISADEACSQLGVDPVHGLSTEEAASRLATHGANVLPEEKHSSLWRVFAQQFASPLIYILFVAAVIAFAMGHRSDAAVILVVVMINAIIGTVQEGRAERSMKALQRLSGLRVRVVRDGEETEIEAGKLVPGDIVLLSAGDAVGADSRVIVAAALEASEAALTGESLPVEKSANALPEDTVLADRRNQVFSGTHIAAGRGRALVVATGTATEVGKIARLTTGATDAKTPLEQRIDQFGRVLVTAALGMFAIVVIVGLLRRMAFLEVFMVAISQMVSMVPEGLPVAMTIALAVGMQRMARRGAIVRRLAAVETLGSTSVICSDKTGTLTKNEMTVTRLWLPDGRELEVTGEGYAPEGTIRHNGEPVDDDDPAVRALTEAALLCNDAQLVPPDREDTRWRPLGDPTEAALITLAWKAGLNPPEVRRRHSRHAEIPFDSGAKMMATSHGAAGVQIKGAPEPVIALCGGDDPELALAAAQSMADQALRVLAVARVDDTELDESAGFDPFCGKTRLLGLIGQMDPPRAEARQAVSECLAAGIRPVMVTGDHKATGFAIARTLGIAREGDIAVDGTELEQMPEQDLRADLDRISVFARVHPEHGRNDRRWRERRPGSGGGGCRRGDGHHRHGSGQERGQDRHHRRQFRHDCQSGGRGPLGLPEPEEGDPLPLRHVDGRGAGAAERPRAWLSPAARCRTDPVDQHCH